MTNFEMVREFHKAFNAPWRDLPVAILPERKALRERLIIEEFEETIQSMIKNDLIGIADGLADLLYVVYGTAVEYGIDIDEVFKEVHRSNMSKLGVCQDCKGKGRLRGGYYKDKPSHYLMIDCLACGGTGEKPILRGDGKVLKGPNYSEPDIKKCLERQFLRD